MSDELLKCEDCGAVFEWSDRRRAFEEEKDACPVCGSWAIAPCEDEEERECCDLCLYYFAEIGECLIGDDFRSGDDWCDQFLADTVTVKAEGLGVV